MPTFLLALVLLGAFVSNSAQTKLLRVNLEHRAPGDGRPAPNFSPKGMQVRLTDIATTAALPAGAVRPARAGMMEVGPSQAAWIPILATASAEFPSDLTQLFLDRNRNGNFADDGPALTAKPSQNAATNAWWTSIGNTELSVPYGGGVVEPYVVSFWIVRDETAPPPDILRFSVRSWRQGTVQVDGVDALVAVMDSDNNALFGKEDTWSAMAASEPNAAKAVLTIAEARPTNRLMFLKAGGKEVVLEFRSLSRDGRSMELAVIDRGITKAADRAPDDLVREERARPRTQVPFAWGHGTPGFNAALARAKAEGKRVFIDFEATWCGPCHTMDEWIWTDAEVASRLSAGFVGVKIDADREKALVKRYSIVGYPTMLVVDATGKEIRRVSDYQASKQMMVFLGK